MKHIIHAATLAAASAFAHAAPHAATYQNWTIGCDNTNHCEAVGYHEETDSALPVALSLARDAGPNAPVIATLTVSGDNPAAIPSVSISVNGLNMDRLPVEKPWPNAHTNAIVPRLLNADAAIFSSGKLSWRLSLAGIKAALLKMDEVQGRLNTPGALVRKGTKPEHSVPAALPMPILKSAGTGTSSAIDNVPASILKSMPNTECVKDGALIARHLGPAKLLILQECYRGAYQSTYQLWTANATAPHRISPVKLQQYDGATLGEVFEPDFNDGVLASYGKGRGINDCGVSMTWLWTADGFKPLSHHEASLCRGIPGGVPVRLYVAAKR